LVFGPYIFIIEEKNIPQQSHRDVNTHTHNNILTDYQNGL